MNLYYKEHFKLVTPIHLILALYLMVKMYHVANVSMFDRQTDILVLMFDVNLNLGQI